MCQANELDVDVELIRFERTDPRWCVSQRTVRAGVVVETASSLGVGLCGVITTSMPSLNFQTCWKESFHGFFSIRPTASWDRLTPGWRWDQPAGHSVSFPFLFFFFSSILAVTCVPPMTWLLISLTQSWGTLSWHLTVALGH